MVPSLWCRIRDDRILFLDLFPPSFGFYIYMPFDDCESLGVLIWYVCVCVCLVLRCRAFPWNGGDSSRPLVLSWPYTFYFLENSNFSIVFLENVERAVPLHGFLLLRWRWIVLMWNNIDLLCARWRRNERKGIRHPCRPLFLCSSAFRFTSELMKLFSVAKCRSKSSEYRAKSYQIHFMHRNT